MSSHDQPKSGDVAFRSDLPDGAHLITKRPGYIHHGIYIGNGRVIHYAGLCSHFCRGPVEIVSIEHFSLGTAVEIVAHPSAKYSGAEVVQRATSRLGERDYRLLTNNCEHLCLWCLFGQARSEQIEACIRNPAHAVAVFAVLVARMISHEWRVAVSARAARPRVAALNA